MGKRRYTHASILAQARRFVVAHGRLPAQADMTPTHGMPHHKTVLLLFGTWEAFHAEILGEPTGILRRCLRCDQLFGSTGAGNRICGVCKLTQDWQETAQWLGREPVNMRATFRGRGVQHITIYKPDEDFYERADE